MKGPEGICMVMEVLKMLLWFRHKSLHIFRRVQGRSKTSFHQDRQGPGMLCPCHYLSVKPYKVRQNITSWENSNIYLGSLN